MSPLRIAPDDRRVPRYSPHMAIRPRVLAVAALAAALQACSSAPMLLDSDVPMPDGMSTVRSADIRRADGTVTGGRFLLAGEVPDAAATLESTAERFVANGWRVVVVSNPDDEPAEWRLQWTRPPVVPFDAVPGAAVAREGGFLYAIAPRTRGQHDAYLARFPEAEIARGDVLAQWWTSSGWVNQTNLVSGPPDVVLEEAGTECSLHRDTHLNRWVFVTSRGFGASTVAMRFAENLTGPWSDLRDVYTPPESRAPNPFVYAAKAHPQLTTGDASELVITYATNSLDPAVLLRPEGQALYWPRFVRVAMAR